MGIRFRCHHCEYELHVKDYQAGRRGKCPKCYGTFRIPTEDAAHSLAVESRKASSAATESAGKQASVSRKRQEQRVSAPASTASAGAASAETPRSQRASGLTGGRAQQKPKASKSDERSHANSATTDKVGKAQPHVESATPSGNAEPELGEEGVSPQEFKPEGSQGPSTTPDAPAAAPSELPPSGSGDIKAIMEAPSAQWYVRPTSGGQFGPVAGELFQQWLLENRVAKDSLVWREGWPEWLLAESALPEYFGPQADSHAPVQAPAASPPPPPPSETGTSGSPAVANGTIGATPALLLRKKRRKRNYVVMLVVLSVLAVVLLTALITAIVLQQTSSS